MNAATGSPPPLTCAEVVQLINDYLEDVLSPGDRVRFDAHIAGCPGCSAYLAQWQATVSTTRRLTESDVADDARQRLLEAFRGWKETPPARPSLLRKIRQLFQR